MKKILKQATVCLFAVTMAFGLTGCGSLTNGKRIIRISHAQSETHPEHLGLLAFKEYVEENLGDKYEVEIFPNELLGSAQKAIELTQTGAIDFVVAGTANLETFASVYEIFSMPYLFDSEDVYKSVMQDTDYMEKIYESTDEAGFRVVTWYNAGTRNFYGKKPINTPDDLKGMKIRVQQSPASVAMVNAFGAAAAPMSFGEVYTAIQQGVIDGAENNVTALRDHGDVTKYYCFDEHTRIPDMVIISSNIWNQFSDDQKSAVTECAKAATEEYKTAWKNFEDEVLDKAVNQNGVELVKDVDIAAFQSAVQPIYENLKTANPTTYAVVEEIRAMV